MVIMEEPPKTNKDASPPSTSRRTFGDIIKEYRVNVLKAGQQECADRVQQSLGIGFTRNGWAKIENSPFRQVHMKRIHAAAAGLGLPFETVLEWARAMERTESPTVVIDIGTNIQNARMGAGIGPGSAADRIGVSQEVYGRWEQGKSSPDAVQMFQLASLFGVSVGTLYGEGAGTSAGQRRSMSEELQEIKDDMDDIREMLRAMRDKED